MNTTQPTNEGDTKMTSETRTKQDWDKIWQHFNRMQKRVMADKVTKKEFFAESEDERLSFYNWLQSQCGEYACWM